MQAGELRKIFQKALRVLREEESVQKERVEKRKRLTRSVEQRLQLQR